MKNIIERIAGGGAKIARYLPKAVSTRLAVAALAAFAVGGAWADITKTNPVTEETETYANTYTGTNGSWNEAGNWDTGSIPYVSGGVYTSALVDGGGTETVVTGTSIDGWEMKLGVYGGAKVTISDLAKWTGGNGTDYATVDASSKLTITSMSGNNWNHVVNYYVASPGGITYTCAFAPANDAATIQYNLAGNGSVVYESTVNKAGHLIKAADVTLSGTPQVVPKTLVSFASTTKTFTADAAIKVYGADGTTLVETVNLATVNSTGETTLTTSDPVGSVELVQTSTGILLYYVDGTPASYTPSININFTNASSSGLGTTDNVGYGSYAVPGGSWNNFTVANNANTQTFGTVAAMNSIGVASTVSGAGVTVSGQRGSFNCSLLTAASNLLYGYIDDGGDYANPTVTITGIPYERYRVIVYAAADTANATFGYMTVNNINYTYVNGALTTGTTAWGNAGADKSANELSEGGNVLVSAVTSGSTATIIGHRSSSTCRGNIAAVQIVEYTPSAGENDLLIELDGDHTYTFDEVKAYDTVYVTGSGTLTFAGEASTASVLDISGSAAVNMNGSTLTPAAVTGNGTAIYTGATPTTGLGWADGSKWQGTLWVKNHKTFSGVVPNTMVNANSTLRLSGVIGYFNNSDSKQTCDGTLELENDAYNYALSVSDGYSTSGITVFAKLKGSGLLGVQTRDIAQRYVFKDASEFTGTFNLAARTLRVILGDGENLSPDEGTITIVSGATATVASGATWTANTGGFRVEGTLNINGTIASTAATAVKGSGTVVFTGRVPTPVDGENETKWWKNAAWTGTVEIDSLTGFVGKDSGTVLVPNDYGNTGSTLELKNCSGWLPVNYECTVPLSVAGTLTIGDGYSGINNAFTIDHLKGSGQITCNGSAPTVLIYVREWSGYTGKVKMDNKMIVFGDDTVTTSDLVSGTIYICEGAVVTNLSNSHWEPADSMKVNGTFAVKARSGWTDGKGAVLGENGIINFIGSGVDDHAYNFSNITGSGKILFTNGTGYSMLPSDASRMPSTDVAVVNDNTESYVVLTCIGTTTIGTLSGSGKFDSRYGNATTRRLAVVQSADSEWSGTFVNDDRVGGMDVSAKSGATAKTLTLSGTQTASNELVVKAATETTDAGSVNLTGTWVGDTTVSGTFGGTGTLTGNLTFNDGATFKVYDGSEPIAVSGTVTFPADGETATIDLTGVTLDPAGTTLISGATSIGAIDKISANGAILKVESGALKAYPVAALTKADDSVVTYPIAQAAVNATRYNSGYKYVTIYQSDVSVTMADTSLKLKLADGVTGVTVSNPSDEFTISSSSESGVTTYTLANNPTVYTWDSGTSAGVWSSLTFAPWRYSKNDTPTEANRAPASGDDVIFASGASVTVGENITVDSITNSAAISFTSSSDVTITATSGGIVLTDAAASITVSGVTLSPKPTTTVANSYVKLTDSTYSVQAFVTVTIPDVANASATVNGDAVAGGASVQVDVGSNVEITWIADSGYKITAGATQTINAIATDETATAPTVEIKGATVGNVAFTYGADFATATVKATVSSEDATAYTLTVGGNSYSGTVNGNTVTFSDVVTGHATAYDSVNYTITAADNESSVAVSEGSGSARVADEKAWINENATTHGLDSAGGSWSNAVTYVDNAASIEDNTFTASSESKGDRVTVTIDNVVYPAISDMETDIGSGAQGAIAISTVGTETVTTNFYVLATNNVGDLIWNATAQAAAVGTEYNIEFTFDYVAKKYSVKVGETLLTVGDNSTFDLCAEKTKVSSIDFLGAGTISGITGVDSLGYMVKDNAGHWYATVQAAIQAFDKANGPYVLLREGTPTDDCKFITEGGVTILKKLVKGMFFLAL